MVLVQKWPFFQIFFLGNLAPENVFYDILERKNALLCYKHEIFKKAKNWHFSEGVNPWFWSKNGHFSKFFFLRNLAPENIFYDILERKNALLGYKNEIFKKAKNWYFSEGVNWWFAPKMGIFPTFFFLGNLGYENVFYDILERENAFPGYKNKKFKKSKIWHFFKRVNPWFCFKNCRFSNFFFQAI